MRRPASIVVLIVLQAILSAVGIVMAGYVLYLTHSPQILKDRDAGNVVHGLYIGAAFLAVPAILDAVVALGVWCRARWAWWTGVVLQFTFAALMIYSAFDENNLDSEDLVMAVIPLVLLAFYFVPGVRHWFITERNVALAPS